MTQKNVFFWHCLQINLLYGTVEISLECILFDYNTGKDCFSDLGKGHCKSGIPKGLGENLGFPKMHSPQIAEAVFHSSVVKPIRLISIVGQMEPPQKTILDVRKESTIIWPTIKRGFTTISQFVREKK